VSLHQEYGLAGTHRYGCCGRAEDDDSDDEAEGQSQQNLAETSSHPIYTGEASPVEDRLPETNGENSAAISSCRIRMMMRTRMRIRIRMRMRMISDTL
jgi:hypothetical protein